jgi:hypothetical protein
MTNGKVSISQRAAVVKPATVNWDVVVLRHMFVKAMAWGNALSNPAAHIQPPSIDRTPVWIPGRKKRSEQES